MMLSIRGLYQILAYVYEILGHLQHISVLCSQRNDFFTQLVLNSKKITQ